MQSTKKASTRPDYRRGMTKTQIREERRRRSNTQKLRRQRLYLFLASFLAIGLIVGLVLPSLPNFLNPNSGAGPVIDELVTPDDGRTHIDTGIRGNRYSTFPPTSGSHYSTLRVELGNGNEVSSPARWGRYDFILPDEVLIHNLEHGGIGLHYDCTDGCPEIQETLASIPPSHWTQFIMSPYPGLRASTGGHPIAVTGWRHLIYLPDASEDSLMQIDNFVRTYQNMAPEPRLNNPSQSPHGG